MEKLDISDLLIRHGHLIHLFDYLNGRTSIAPNNPFVEKYKRPTITSDKLVFRRYSKLKKID